MFNLSVNCQTVFQSGCSILHFWQQYMRFQFLHILVNTCLFDYSHPSEYEVVFHCGFDLHFPTEGWSWASFCVLIDHVYFIGRNVCSDLLPILKMGYLSFYWVLRILYFSDRSHQKYDLQIFSAILYVVFHFLNDVFCQIKAFKKFFFLNRPS